MNRCDHWLEKWSIQHLEYARNHCGGEFFWIMNKSYCCMQRQSDLIVETNHWMGNVLWFKLQIDGKIELERWNWRFLTIYCTWMDFEVGLKPTSTIHQSLAQKIENRCNFMNIRSANFDITFFCLRIRLMPKGILKPTSKYHLPYLRSLIL